MTRWNIVKNGFGIRMMWNNGRGFHGLLINLIWKTGKA
jgi:hypothetical protein